MTSTLIFIFLVSFLAFSVSAICGGGAGLMLIPILGMLLPASQIPAALSIGTFSSSFSRVVVFREKICWRIVRYFVPAALPAAWLGAWLLRYVNPVYLGIALGLFLLSNLTFLFKKSKEINESETPSNFVLALIGVSAGFISGLTGAVGLLFNRFYLRYGLSKEEVVATRAANEIVLHLAKIVFYILFGLITSKVVAIGVVVALAAVFSTWMMKWILPRLSEVLFRKIGYFAMVVSGVLMISRSSADLFEDKQGRIEAAFKSNGFESKLKWEESNYAIEFSWDEGFEFEQVIPFSELREDQQHHVKNQFTNADRIVIEVVYTFREKSYEAYYYENNVRIGKIDFT